MKKEKKIILSLLTQPHRVYMEIISYVLVRCPVYILVFYKSPYASTLTIAHTLSNNIIYLYGKMVDYRHVNLSKVLYRFGLEPGA